MRGYLSVRVNDGSTDRIVTTKTHGLKFRKTAPGGHHSASCRLILPRGTFRDLGPADQLYIYDARTAKTIWEGYTENPGVTDGPAGQEYDLAAMGGMVLASDQSEKLIYIDRAYNAWEKDTDHPQQPSGRAAVDLFPSDAGTRSGNPALFTQFEPGAPVSTSYQAGLIYNGFRDSQMTLGAFAGFYDAGQNDVNYKLEWVAELAGGSQQIISAIDQSSTGTNIVRYATTDFVAGKDTLVFRIVRRAGGATTIATGNDNVWACWGEIVLFGHLIDRDGTDRTMSTTAHISTGGVDGVTGYLLASDVAEDLLGRLLTMCDPDTATIDTSTAEVDQLAYYDGATAARVLDDLTLYEPDFTWEILERLPNGLHRFNFRAWPTTPRYEISTKDGYSATGGEVDLCNRIAVYWTDEKGNKQATTVTATVDALGSRTRDAESFTIPEGQGSSVNATRIGEQILAQKNDPPKAATAVVSRPILDHLTGATVMPWEIEPGYLVRVRETGDDLRLTEMEYDDATCSTALTLGTPVRSLEQMLAETVGRA